MKKDNLIVVGLVGVAGVLVAKAMGFNVASLTGQKAAATTFAQSIWNPFNPISGTSYNPANPGAYIPNSQLINGTIHDYYSGDYSSYETPTINDIAGDVLASLYGTGGRSVVKKPGIYW